MFHLPRSGEPLSGQSTSHQHWQTKAVPPSFLLERHLVSLADTAYQYVGLVHPFQTFHIVDAFIACLVNEMSLHSSLMEVW